MLALRKFSGLFASLALALGVSATASASDYPNRTIKVVVPYAAGASTDGLSRLVAREVSEDLGVPVVAENRAGAGGSIAADYVKRQPGDGYTFMLSTDGILATNPNVYKSLTYNSLEDFSPLTIAVGIPLVLVVNANSPFKTAQELLAYAKANPGKLSYGSSGIGSSQHIAGELMKQMAGVDIPHIPYRGGAPAMTDLLGGHHDMMHVQIASAQKLAQDNKIRILAIGSAQRSKVLPDVPTFDEVGLKGFVSDTWYGFSMPKATDPVAQKKLSDAIIRALHKNRAYLDSQGYTIIASSPEAMQENVVTNLKKWEEIAKAAGFYQAH